MIIKRNNTLLKNASQQRTTAVTRLRSLSVASPKLAPYGRQLRVTANVSRNA
jgi:hypothetical protein